MHHRFLVLILVLISVIAVNAQQDAEPAPKPVKKANARPEAPEPKPEPFDNATVAEMTKCVTFDTAAGIIELEMFPETAPNTVRNFLNLTAIKAFDNTLFTRVVPGFVIQGGNLWSNPDVTTDMKWRASRTIPDEPNLVRHERGILSMARGDEPDSARTSFFILVADASSLDNKFAAFGRVVKGMEVVDAINKAEVEDETPKTPVLIKTAVVKACEEGAKPVANIVGLPQFGLLGNVKTVHASSINPDGTNSKMGSRGWGYPYAAKELEFEKASGELIESRFFDEEHLLIMTESYSSTLEPDGRTVGRVEVVNDAAGRPRRKLQFVLNSPGVFSFQAIEIDRGNALVGKGEIKKNENGRIVLELWERIGYEGQNLGQYSEEISYNSKGLEETLSISDENSTGTVFFRFEYTIFDDNGNWIERKVYDSKNAKTPVRIENRVITYYL